jgi:DNA-binding response OmpR family regulator
MAVIMIVEDEAQVRVLSESFLQEQGHQTLSAATLMRHWLFWKVT